MALRLTVPVVSFILFSTALSPFAGAASIIPILAPEGYFSAEGDAINGAGQVAVTLYNADGDPTTALFTPGVGLSNIGAGNGTGNGTSISYGIGKDGTIAATYFPSLPAPQAELLPTSGGHTNLSNLGGMRGSQLMAINDSGVAVGSSYTNASGSNSHDHPVYWDANGVHDMGVLGGSSTFGRAFAINASGLAVGTAGASDDNINGKAFTYQIGAQNAKLTAIPNLGTGFSDAYAVNNLGQIVGDFTVNGHLNAFLSVSGATTNLGTLGGDESVAYSINSSGQIVGYSADADGDSDAFLYQNGQMIDLNSLLPQNSGWTLEVAYGINDAGQIVGYGTFNDQSQGFLLNTVDSVSAPEPMSFLLCGLGLAGLAVRRARRN